MILELFNYVGDGTDNRVIELATCSPDFVLLRGELQAGVFRTSSMIGDATKVVAGTNAVQAGYIKSFGTNNFVVGSDDKVNELGTVYVGVAIEDNGACDFGLTEYVGDGTDNRNIEICDVIDPIFVLVGAEEATVPIWRTGVDAGVDESFQFNSGGLLSNHIQAVSPTSIEVGDNIRINGVGDHYHVVAIRATPGIFFATDYTGNGVDNRNIVGADFTPGWAWVQSKINLARWVEHHNPDVHGFDQSSIFTDGGGSGVNSNRIQDIIVGGIQIGNNGAVNANGEFYQAVFMASGISEVGDITGCIDCAQEPVPPAEELCVPGVFVSIPPCRALPESSHPVLVCR